MRDKEVTDGIDVIKELVLGCVGGVGVIFLAWGLLDFGTGYSSHDTTQQSQAIKKVHGEGIIMMQTPFGRFVPVYNMERTICDIIRNRNNMETQTFQGALKQYAKRKDKNLRLLMQYAAKFHVDKILKQYLEVLL